MFFFLSLVFFLFLVFAIYYLRQITTWTLPSFRQGIVIVKYKESFPSNIPEDILNQEILCQNIMFKFNTPNIGLFRVHPKFALFKRSSYAYFPSLLGEIRLNHKGMAQIALRIPLFTILMSVTLLLVLVITNTEGVITINSIFASLSELALVMLVVGIIVSLHFIMEISDLKYGVMSLSKRAKTNSLTQEK